MNLHKPKCEIINTIFSPLGLFLIPVFKYTERVGIGVREVSECNRWDRMLSQWKIKSGKTFGKEGENHNGKGSLNLICIISVKTWRECNENTLQEVKNDEESLTPLSGCYVRLVFWCLGFNSLRSVQ